MPWLSCRHEYSLWTNGSNSTNSEGQKPPRNNNRPTNHKQISRHGTIKTRKKNHATYIMSSRCHPLTVIAGAWTYIPQLRTCISRFLGRARVFSVQCWCKLTAKHWNYEDHSTQYLILCLDIRCAELNCASHVELHVFILFKVDYISGI